MFAGSSIPKVHERHARAEQAFHQQCWPAVGLDTALFGDANGEDGNQCHKVVRHGIELVNGRRM